MGEAKRRQAAGGEADQGLVDHRNTLREHMSHSEIGTGWIPQDSIQLPVNWQDGKPSNCAAVHFSLESTRLTVVIPVDHIDRALQAWARFGESRDETRRVICEVLLEYRQRERDGLGMLMPAALWLACTSEMGDIVREHLRHGGEVMFEIARVPDEEEFALSCRMSLLPRADA